jgi:hypothetical protein
VTAPGGRHADLRGNGPTAAPGGGRRPRPACRRHGLRRPQCARRDSRRAAHGPGGSGCDHPTAGRHQCSGLLPAQPDERRPRGLGSAGHVERALRARPRQPGTRQHHRSLQHGVDPAGSPHARIREVPARHLALLAHRRSPRFPRRELRLHPDAAVLQPGPHRSPGDSDPSRRRGAEHDAPGR